MRLLFLLLLSCGTVAQAHEVCMRLACYHYAPNEPYIDPKHKPLFKHVFAKIPICGTIHGTFLTASSQHAQRQIEAECDREIPKGHRILKMRAATKTGQQYIVSFENTQSVGQFKRIVVFGDSLSEEGKAVSFLQKLRHPITGAALSGVAKLVGCPVPKHFLDFGLRPYWNGAFSNGPIWPRYLSDFLGNVAIDNRSFGGATTGPRRCRMKHLHTMVKKHLRDNAKADLSENLYLIWLGGNNYFYADGIAPIKIAEIDRRALVKKSITDLAEAVDVLFARGAQHIVLFTIPNPKESPSWQFCDESACFETHKREWHESVTLHNQELKARIGAMGAKWGRRVSLFDIDAVLQNEGAELGLDTKTLWRFARTPDTPHEALQKVGFFDAVHPTTKVHCLVAQRLLNHLIAEGLVDQQRFAVSRAPTCDQKVLEFGLLDKE